MFDWSNYFRIQFKLKRIIVRLRICLVKIIRVARAGAPDRHGVGERGCIDLSLLKTRRDGREGSGQRSYCKFKLSPRTIANCNRATLCITPAPANNPNPGYFPVNNNQLPDKTCPTANRNSRVSCITRAPIDHLDILDRSRRKGVTECRRGASKIRHRICFREARSHNFGYEADAFATRWLNITKNVTTV